jgi:hypothetical protein
MSGGRFLASADQLARFESDERRLLDLVEFCRNGSEQTILGFWDWDAHLNEQPFGKGIDKSGAHDVLP